MADLKPKVITELPETTDPTNSTAFPVWHQNDTHRITWETIVNKIRNALFPISIQNGGTGSVNAAGARANLGLGSVATESTVPISKGGTGATTAAAAREGLGITAATQVIISGGATGVTVYGRATKDETSGVVRVFLTARSASAFGVSTVLGVLPAGYRPASTALLAGMFVAGGVAAAYYGAVSATGEITQSLGNSVTEAVLVGEFLA